MKNNSDTGNSTRFIQIKDTTSDHLWGKMRRPHVNEMTHCSAKATEWEQQQDGVQHHAAPAPALASTASTAHLSVCRDAARSSLGGHLLVEQQKKYQKNINTTTNNRCARCESALWRRERSSHVVYPVDSSCRAFRGAQLVSLRREDLLAPAALHGSSFGVFAHIGLFSLFVSSSGWLKTTARREEKKNPALRSAAFVLILSPLSQQRRSWFLFFVCNISGFVVGTFPFINVHWCSRKRGGDKVGKSVRGEPGSRAGACCRLRPNGSFLCGVRVCLGRSAAGCFHW